MDKKRGVVTSYGEPSYFPTSPNNGEFKKIHTYVLQWLPDEYDINPNMLTPEFGRQYETTAKNWTVLRKGHYWGLVSAASDFCTTGTASQPEKKGGTRRGLRLHNQKVAGPNTAMAVHSGRGPFSCFFSDSQVRQNVRDNVTKKAETWEQ